MVRNDIDKDISLAENDIDRDISLAKNYIDREDTFEEAKRGFGILGTISSLLLTLSVNNISNQREGLCLEQLSIKKKCFAFSLIFDCNAA